MRGWTVTLVVFLCAVVVAALFHFLVMARLNEKLDKLKDENNQLETRLDELANKEQEIPVLVEQIPEWKEKIKLYKAAIPSAIEDEVFLSYLNDQLKSQNVELLNAELSPGGAWLGNLKEEQSQQLTGMGVDVDEAKNIKVAFYSMRLIGDYENVLQAFENMKRYRRLYCIDEVVSPAGGGGGTVMQIVDQSQMPMQVTGKIFYGIREDYVSESSLNVALNNYYFRPRAARIHRSLVTTADEVVARTSPATSSEGQQ